MYRFPIVYLTHLFTIDICSKPPFSKSSTAIPCSDPVVRDESHDQSGDQSHDQEEPPSEVSSPLASPVYVPTGAEAR